MTSPGRASRSRTAQAAAPATPGSHQRRATARLTPPIRWPERPLEARHGSGDRLYPPLEKPWLVERLVPGRDGGDDPAVVLAERVRGVHPNGGLTRARAERPAGPGELSVLREPEQVVAALGQPWKPLGAKLERPVPVAVARPEPDEAGRPAGVRGRLEADRRPRLEVRAAAEPRAEAEEECRQRRRECEGRRDAAACPERRRGRGVHGAREARGDLRRRRGDGAEERVDALELGELLLGDVVADELPEVVAIGHSDSFPPSSSLSRARPARVRVLTVPSGTSR